MPLLSENLFLSLSGFILDSFLLLRRLNIRISFYSVRSLERVLKINFAQNIYSSVFFYGILKKKVMLVMPKRYELERVEKSSNVLRRRLNIDVFTCLNFHLPRCAR